MNASRFSNQKLVVEKLSLPEGGFDPGPAPDGLIVLPNRLFTQPCRAPTRGIFDFQMGAGD